MKDFSPSSLPPVTAVEIVLLKSVNPKIVSEYMQATQASKGILVEGTAAIHLAELWRRLPAGEQSRCHIPPFGLRFFAGDVMLCQGSICWECDNIFGDVQGDHFAYQFDSSSEASQALLAELRRLTSRTDAGNR